MPIDNTYNCELHVTDDDLQPGPSEIVFCHVDDFDLDMIEHSIEIHIYAFASESKADVLESVADACRNEYVYPITVVWPDSARSMVESADTHRLRELEWALMVCPFIEECTADDLASVADMATEWIES